MKSILFRSIPGILGRIGRMFAATVYVAVGIFLIISSAMFLVIADTFAGRLILLTLGVAGSIFD